MSLPFKRQSYEMVAFTPCIDNDPLVDLIILIKSAPTIYKDLLSTSGFFALIEAVIMLDFVEVLIYIIDCFLHKCSSGLLHVACFFVDNIFVCCRILAMDLN